MRTTTETGDRNPDTRGDENTTNKSPYVSDNRTDHVQLNEMQALVNQSPRTTAQRKAIGDALPNNQPGNKVNDVIQLKVILKDETFIKYLGEGSFGMGFETDKGHVAKAMRVGDGKEEYEILEKIYQSKQDDKILVARPIFHGQLQKYDNQFPTAFDASLKSVEYGFLMEKLNPLTLPKDIIAKPDKTTKDQEIEKICTEELETFKEMIQLRKNIIDSGFLHGDIRRTNVGRDSNNTLKAFDVGRAKSTSEMKPPKKNDASILNIWVLNDDYFISYRGALDMMLSRLGMPSTELSEIMRNRDENGVVPNELLDEVIDARWSDATAEEKSTVDIEHLRRPTIDWITKTFRNWMDKK